MKLLCLTASLGILLTVQSAVFAQQIYKWTDENGKTRYSDSPPAGDAAVSRVHIEPGPTEAQRQQAENLSRQQAESAEAYRVRREAEKARAAQQAQKQNALKEAAEDEQAQKEENNSHTTTRCRPGDIGWPCTRPPPVNLPARPVPPPRPKPGKPGRPVTLPAKTGMNPF